MAISSQRRITPDEVRQFGTIRTTYDIPDLTEIQTKSYERFLQYEIASEKRKVSGLEGVLQEIFPIESYDKSLQLEYIRYELGKPRYSPAECKQLRLTYGRPFRVWLRLTKDEPIEEEVYLGDLPVMLGGGEFIINGAERVVVSQLHRSPGVDFVTETDAGERKLHSCRIIPERGSWIEINSTKKDTLTVRIDQSGKFSATTLLRAMDPKYSQDSDILAAFYDVSTEKVVDGRSVGKIEGKVAAEDIVYGAKSDKSGEIICECGHRITKNTAEVICTSGLKSVKVMEVPKTPVILNALNDDTTSSHEEALLRIYQRLRPGNPPQLEKARTLFNEKFFDTNRYRLGRVGRFRINRKLDLSISENGNDAASRRPRSRRCVTCCNLCADDEEAEIDDIDHLGNRRLRTIDELGLRRNAQGLPQAAPHRARADEPEGRRGHDAPQLINPKSVAAAIEYFFGRGELSQVVDQTNPLSMLTHERRLSALGPGGLNRKASRFRSARRAHFALWSHLPDRNAGRHEHRLDLQPGDLRGVDDYGFLITPYRVVKKGKLTDEVVWLRADEESEAYVAPADAAVEKATSSGTTSVARYRSDFEILVPIEEVEYIDVAPSQMVGVSAGLIPFLEHDDANRALMGSNMQRQAVPLLVAEPPVVAHRAGKGRRSQLEACLFVLAAAGTVTVRRRRELKSSVTKSTN